MMFHVALSADEIDLLFYCIEQQSYEMDDIEEAMIDRIIDELTAAQSAKP